MYWHLLRQKSQHNSVSSTRRTFCAGISLRLWWLHGILWMKEKEKMEKKKKTCSSDSSHKITIFFLCNSKYNLPLFIPLYFLSIPCNLTNHHEVSSMHLFCCCLCVLRNNDDVRPVLPVWFCGSIGRRNRWVSATRTFEWYYYYCILANTARPTKITRTLWIVIYFFLLRLLPF